MYLCKMNKDIQLIALTLTNIVNTDSEVNLLSSPSGENNSVFDTYYKIDFLNIFPNVTVFFTYDLNGIEFDYSVAGGSAVNDIDSLILDLNNNLGTYALFSYELSSTPNYYTLIIKILDSNFVPVQFLENNLF